MIALALLMAAAEPCALPAPAAASDPAGAAVYADVGESERAAGRDESARVAFQAALRLDPSNAAAARGFDAVCAGARFDEGRRLLDQGDARGAAALFARMRAAAPSRPAALLEGIARFQLEDDAGARPLLLDAAQDPGLADSARFYLGLLALREDDAAAAASQLDRVSPAAPFAGTAAELSRQAHRSGRLVLSLLADSGYDSNVSMLPSGTAAGKDGLGSVALAAVAQPLGADGPWLRASGTYRAQLQLHDYDVGAVSGAAGWQLGRPARHLDLEYDYDYVALGAAPFLSAHRLSASAAGAVGRLLLNAAYAVRFESYQTSVTSTFSGVLHTGSVLAGLRLGTATVRAGYQAGRDFAQLASTSFFEHGPRLVLDAPLGDRARLVADGTATFRSYDGYDDQLAVQRADTLLDATVALDLDLTARLTLRGALTGRRAISNAPDLSYNRVAATLGLLVSAGFL